MKQLNSYDDSFDAGDDLNNIIRINNTSEADDDMDYDLDYDPNEMYYALHGR